MGSVRLYGATSGYVELAAPAVAGTTDVVLPAQDVDLSALGAAWTAGTGTVGAISGSITTAAGTFRYAAIGKIVVLAGRVHVTTNGSGSLGVTMSGLPFTSANVGFNYAGVGREVNVTGKQLQVVMSPNTALLTIRNYDNTYPAGDGYMMDFSLTYEAA